MNTFIKKLLTNSAALKSVVVMVVFASLFTFITTRFTTNTPQAQAIYSCQLVYLDEADDRFDESFDSAAACNEALLGTHQLNTCSDTCGHLDGCLCPSNCPNNSVIELGQSCAGDEFPVGSCYTKNSVTGQCTLRTPEQCEITENQGQETYGSLSSCQAGGSFSCDSEDDCPGTDTVCNLTNNKCELKSTTIGNGGQCNTSYSYSTNGQAGDLCCQGGVQECASGACSASGEATFGTCLAGTGGPVSGPTQDQCIADGFDFRCGDCGGFCGNYADGTCKQQAYARLANGQCAEGIQNGGSCAVQIPGGPDVYDEAQYMCKVYCTNIVGKDGDDCSASAGRPPGTCSYVGPENPNYDEMCPDGNGYGALGWDGQCFDTQSQNANLYNFNSYYCPCPNNNCNGVSLGQGCQDGLMAGNACFQTGNCGVLQVDADLKNPAANPNLPAHTSRNKLLTSGCVEQPDIEPPDDVIVNPPPSASPSPASYFCNSPCTTNGQCQGADDDFICSQQHGNRCRLEENPGSATCQPPVGPQCLSLSMTNVSDPTAPATADPEFGDAVTFTCGLVSQADHYIFRVIEPDGTIVNLQATGATSAQYTIDQSGSFVAQCQICTGAAESTCHAYEPPN